MKSAYGFAIPKENEQLTHIGPGTPAGELLRRYWQPVAVADRLADLPRRVRILGEDLVVFRDGQGRVGALHPHCAHRGTSLEFGRIEQRGIRCCYHGWLYAIDGRCIEMPCETPDYAERMNVWQPAYPAVEFGGLVFVYMGPPEKEPPFPILDIYDTRARKDITLRGLQIWGDASIGFVRDCNWLQHYENVVDPWHLVVLHQQVGLGKFDGPLIHGRAPDISFERTAAGVRYKLMLELPNGNQLERYTECVLPNIFLVSNIHEDGAEARFEDKASEVSWVVPVDNDRVTAFTIAAWPLVDGAPDPNWWPRTDTAKPGGAPLNRGVPSAGRGARAYDERQRLPDDIEAQEGQRAIAIHALENLGLADRGIVLLRRMLVEEIEKVARGEDPINIVRDGSAAIRTHAWNTVRVPADAE